MTQCCNSYSSSSSSTDTRTHSDDVTSKYVRMYVKSFPSLTAHRAALISVS